MSGVLPIEFSAAIAPITARDLNAVAELLRQTLVESGVDPEIVTNRYTDNWIRSSSAAFGARIGSRLVGYAILERGAGPFGAVALSILERYRRQGLGERLMRALLDEVHRSDEIREVWLSVAPDNLPARALYEKLGFENRADPPAELFTPAAYLTMLWRPDR